MENKQKASLTELIIVGIFIAASILTFKFALDVITTSASISKEDNSALKIHKDIYDSISHPADYGTAISLDEPGFGKSNPFDPLKQ